MITVDLAALQELLADPQKQVQLVEVLDAEEYGWAHLPGAINVPLKTIGETVPEAIDPARPVVAYCNDFL